MCVCVCMCECGYVCVYVEECDGYKGEGLTSKPPLICVCVHFSLLFACMCVYGNTPLVQFKHALLFLIGHRLSLSEHRSSASSVPIMKCALKNAWNHHKQVCKKGVFMSVTAVYSFIYFV